MDLTPENKKTIDNMVYRTLLFHFMNASESDPWFYGETGEYWKQRIVELKNNPINKLTLNSWMFRDEGPEPNNLDRFVSHENKKKGPMEKVLERKNRGIYHFVNGVKIKGNHSKISGENRGLYGNCTDFYGDWTGLVGNCSGLIGNCSGLTGRCSNLYGDCSGLCGDCSGFYGDCTGFYGNCCGLIGNCTGLIGDCSNLYGVITYLMGECTGLEGWCTGLYGNLNMIPMEERKEYPDIKDWVI